MKKRDHWVPEAFQEPPSFLLSGTPSWGLMNMKETSLLKLSLAQDELIVAPGAYDSLSAKIIEQAGFKAVFLSGFGLSASLLGKPDIGLLTMTEVVTQARNVAQAVNVPVLADAEAGYGGIANVQRTVREFETAGVAGIFIEDQEHPVMCGSLQKYKKIVSPDDMVIKIRAALDARDDSDFIIAARTDADVVSLDEQIRRCNIYAEAGADLVMPVLRDSNEYEIVAKEIKAPLWLLLGTWVDLTPDDLKKFGVRGIVTHAVESTFAATKAIIDLMDEIRTKGTVRETLNKLGAPDFRDFFRLIGLREITAQEEKIATEGPAD